MSKPWSPQLFPNEQVSPEDMQYPLIAMYKLDGIRCIIKDGKLFSRSMKPIPNKNLWDKFAELRKLTEGTDLILDGEIYDHSLKRNEIVSYVMSYDKEVPESLEYWCFDVPSEKPFIERWHNLLDLQIKYGTAVIRHPRMFPVVNAKMAKIFMRCALGDDYEGLILVNPDSKYKHGRITVKSGDGYKLKPYRTFDSQIISVEQATEVDPDAEKKINELGHSVTSKKKEDRIPIEKASAFVVWYESAPTTKHYKDTMTGQEVDVTIIDGSEIKVSLTSMTHKEQEEVWKNRESYIGKWIEWKGMEHGMKDVPSHPTFIRFREDLDDYE